MMTDPKKYTKKQLADRLQEVNADNTELADIIERTKTKLIEYEKVLKGIIAIHAPYLDNSQLMPADGLAPKVIMRCTVCDTPEHHTWGNDNDEMWPCATLRLFVETQPSPIEAES